MSTQGGAKLAAKITILPLLCALAISCNDSPHWSVDEADEETSARWEELRRRMDTTVVNRSTGEREEWSATALFGPIGDECMAAVPTPCANVLKASEFLPSHLLTPGVFAGNGDCDARACASQVRLCVANRLMEIADSAVGSEEPISVANAAATIEYNIPPQDEAAQAGLHLSALRVARATVQGAGIALRGESPQCAATGLSQFFPSDNSFNNGEILAHALSEATGLVREAAHKVQEEYLAVADEAYSTERSESRAAHTAFNAPVLSRGSMAHLLIGHPSGTDYSDIDSPSLGNVLPISGGAPAANECLTSDSAPGVRRAMDIFREAGLSPAQVANSAVSTNDLVFGTGGAIEAIQDQLNATENAPTEPGDMGVTLAQLETARQVLVAENELYRRDTSVILPNTPMVGTQSHSRYAATAQPPARRGREFWTASVHTSHTAISQPAFPGTAMEREQQFPSNYAETSVAATLDYAYSTAAYLVTTSLGDKIKAGVLALAQEAERERPTRILANANSGAVEVHAYGRTAANTTVVRGDSGLECATAGTVEGVQCNLADFELPTGTAFAPQMRSGFDEGVRFLFAGSGRLNAGESDQYYLLAIEGNGVYSPIAGFHVSYNGGQSQSVVSVIGETEEMVRETIERDTERQCRPATDCAGIDVLTQRVPLENELSQDGDAFENSWRTYLALARRAADEADLLGQQLIDQGLSMDMRAEAAMDELENICGGTVDVGALLSADSNMGVISTETCTTVGAACTTGEGYVCTDLSNNGSNLRCALDPVQAILARDPANDDENMTRLRACLGVNETRLAALGSKEVCLWRRTGNANTLCTNDINGDGNVTRDASGIRTEGFELGCPFFPADVGAESCSAVNVSSLTLLGGATADPAAFEVIGTDVQLGVFEASGLGPNFNTNGRGAVCDAVRSLRFGPNEPALQTIQSSGVFKTEDAYAVAQSIGFEHRFGDYSRLTRNGGTWVAYTGDLRSGPDTSRWPCMDEDRSPQPFPGVTCEPGSEAFFCQSIDCTNAEERLAFGRRSARALWTLAVAIYAETPGGRGEVDFNQEYYSYSYGTTLTRFTPSIPDYGDRIAFLRPYLVGRLFVPIRYSGPRQPVFIDNAATTMVTDNESNVWRLERGSATHLVRRRGDVDFPFEHSDDARLWSPLLDPSTRSGYIELVGVGAAEPFGRVLSGLHGVRRAPSRFVEILTGRYRSPIRDSAADLLELICEAGRNPSAEPTELCGQPPNIQSVQDLPAYSHYMSCLADAIEQAGERLVFPALSEAAVRAILEPGAQGAYPENGGAHGSAVVQLRQALRSYPRIRRNVALELRNFGEMVSQIRDQLENFGIDENLATLRMASTISSQAASCAASASGLSFSAIAVCANAAVQIGIAVRTATLDAQRIENNQSTALSNFRQSFNGSQEAMQRALDEMRAVSEQVDGLLIQLESNRDAARRALSRASFADQDSTGRYYQTNTVMRRRFNTTQARYERARTYAVRMAALARIALEQRLGTRLENLPVAEGGELSLVQHPKAWANSVCMASGIDYRRIRDSRQTQFESYAGEFIGDYVRRLEAVVESYRLDFPFSDGQDTSVISLRDEVFNVREDCDPEFRRNLIDQSTNLNAPPAADNSRFGWQAQGCVPVTLNSESVTVDCAYAEPLALDEANAPITREGSREAAGSVAFRVRFGQENVSNTTDATPHNVAAPAASSFRTGVVYAQQLPISSRRRYRLSYYARSAGTLVGPSPGEAVRLVNSAGTPLGGAVGSAAANGGWTRYWRIIDATGQASGETYFVHIKPNVSAGATNQAIDVAGVMVEDVTGDVSGTEMIANVGPASFEHSDHQYQLCEDTDGSVFRARHWARACDLRCPVANSSCDLEDKVTECYWETNFNIGQSEIEDRSLIQSGGFARGNYNYRAESVALNLVGAAIRDCEGVDSSACYANGSISYSVEHTGPFVVRDHQGNTTYEAPLFDGRVEHARALTAERYITNPISSGDRALVEPYSRYELRGRPLAGNYRIRIWDEPGVRFERIEDVQVVLGYRYWTRLN